MTHPLLFYGDELRRLARYALVGIGAIRLWEIYQKRSLLTGLLTVAICGGTLAFQIYTANQYVSHTWWAIPAGIVFIVGALTLLGRRKVQWLAAVGFVCVLIATLWVSTTWAAMTTLYSNASSSLPEAYSGSGAASQDDGRRDGNMQFGGSQQGTTNTQLLNYLEANTTDVEYLVAVSSSMQGAPYVLATGRPVLYMGGFSGSDPVVDPAKLSQLVSEGKLRYVLSGGGGMMGNSKSDVSA